MPFLPLETNMDLTGPNTGSRFLPFLPYFPHNPPVFRSCRSPGLSSSHLVFTRRSASPVFSLLSLCQITWCFCASARSAVLVTDTEQMFPDWNVFICCQLVHDLLSACYFLPSDLFAQIPLSVFRAQLRAYMPHPAQCWQKKAHTVFISSKSEQEQTLKTGRLASQRHFLLAVSVQSKLSMFILIETEDFNTDTTVTSYKTLAYSLYMLIDVNFTCFL